jgi:3-oxoacyl-[acyl-carrier-protein] synthase II
MESSRTRTVLTGLGLLTPIGVRAEPVWQNLMAGKSGVKRISVFDPGGLPVQIAGEITDFDGRKFVDKKQGKGFKMMARAIQLGVAAANLALQDAKLDPTKLDPTRFGVDFGASLVATDLEDLIQASHLSAPEGIAGKVDFRTWGEKGLPTIEPLWMLKYLPNMVACHTTIMFNAQGPNNTVTENEVAPLLALAEANRIMRRGLADVMLSGGSDSRINPLSMTRLNRFMRLSHRNDDPAHALRPFDKDRDGTVPGEGSGILVLETLVHAKQRGARILAEIAGCGAAFDTKRNGDGIARAIQAAMKQAKVQAADLDHINAHGFGDVEMDRQEAAGITKVFGAQTPPVFAAKGCLSNMGAAGGAVELGISALAFQHGTLPPTKNFQTPDDTCRVNMIAGQPHQVTKDYALKISFSDMGQCAAVVIKRWRE